MSSARVVRCWVKSRNERNPYGQLLRKSTLAGLPLKLFFLSEVEAGGIPSVAVKCVDIRRNTSGEGGLQGFN